MAETCSEGGVGKDNKLHLRQKYMYTNNKYINAVGCLNTVLLDFKLS
jgi:hypothetical protein